MFVSQICQICDICVTGTTCGLLVVQSNAFFDNSVTNICDICLTDI